MSRTSTHRFSPIWDFSKLGMILAAYVPIVWGAHGLRPGGRPLVAGIAVYLLLSLSLRNLRLSARIAWPAATAWLVIDFLAWFVSAAWSNWPLPLTLVGLGLCADAAMTGWLYRRGLVHALLASLFVAAGPILSTDPLDHAYLVRYLLPVLPGCWFVYVFVYLTGRMHEERTAAALAQQAAETAQHKAEQAHRAVDLVNSQLREYAGQVEELAVLRERNRLAREVHDTIAHSFTSIHMQLEVLERLVEGSESAAELVVQVKDHVGESLDEIRRSIHALRPLQLEEAQGLAALERLVAEFRRATGVGADLVTQGQPVPLPATHELCLFRTAQEGLTNAFRHGQASRARVRLTFQPAAVQLTVEDNGTGATGAVAGGLGIIGIQERAAVLAGRVEAGTARTGGFVLQVTLPLAAADDGRPKEAF